LVGGLGPDEGFGFVIPVWALKAVLTARGVPFERSHDIDYLCGLIEDSGDGEDPSAHAAIVGMDPSGVHPADQRVAAEMALSQGSWSGPGVMVWVCERVRHDFLEGVVHA
jgi:hypothetical protein